MIKGIYFSLFLLLMSNLFSYNASAVVTRALDVKAVWSKERPFFQEKLGAWRKESLAFFEYEKKLFVIASFQSTQKQGDVTYIKDLSTPASHRYGNLLLYSPLFYNWGEEVGAIVSPDGILKFVARKEVNPAPLPPNFTNRDILALMRPIPTREVDLKAFSQETQVPATLDFNISRGSENNLIDPANDLSSWSVDLTKNRDFNSESISQVVDDDKINEIVTYITAGFNVLLVGEPGTGKSTLMEALAQRISTGQVASIPRTRKVLKFSPETTEGGTIYRGQFAEKINSLVANAKIEGGTIGFFDEADIWAGLGLTEGSRLDFMATVRPHLTGPFLRMIFATTPQGVSTFLKDSSYKRRFKVVTYDERQGSQLIREIQEAIFIRTKFREKEDLIAKAVDLTNTFGDPESEGAQPDRAIKFLMLFYSWWEQHGDPQAEEPIIEDLVKFSKWAHPEHKIALSHESHPEDVKQELGKQIREIFTYSDGSWYLAEQLEKFAIDMVESPPQQKGRPVSLLISGYDNPINSHVAGREGIARELSHILGHKNFHVVEMAKFSGDGPETLLRFTTEVFDILSKDSSPTLFFKEIEHAGKTVQGTCAELNNSGYITVEKTNKDGLKRDRKRAMNALLIYSSQSGQYYLKNEHYYDKRFLQQFIDSHSREVKDSLSLGYGGYAVKMSDIDHIALNRSFMQSLRDRVFGTNFIRSEILESALPEYVRDLLDVISQELSRQYKTEISLKMEKHWWVYDELRHPRYYPFLENINFGSVIPFYNQIGELIRNPAREALSRTHIEPARAYTIILEEEREDDRRLSEGSRNRGTLIVSKIQTTGRPRCEELTADITREKD